jgi:hypothetical protein
MIHNVGSRFTLVLLAVGVGCSESDPTETELPPAPVTLSAPTVAGTGSFEVVWSQSVDPGFLSYLVRISDSPGVTIDDPLAAQSTLPGLTRAIVEGLEDWTLGTGGGAADDVAHVDWAGVGEPTGSHNRDGSDSELRVRLVDDAQVEYTLIDWSVQTGAQDQFNFMEVSADISAWAGQSVTIYIEQGDNDVGIHEKRYIDNVIVR